MKRLFLFLLVTLIFYIVYFDLSTGTIPTNKTAITTNAVQNTEQKNGNVIKSFSKTVSQGDTVLSIIESKLNGPLPVPLAQIVTDFMTLNNGKKPEEIQAGQSYLFPDYSKSEEN